MTVCLKGRINCFVFLFVVCSLLLCSSCRKNENTVGDDFVGAIVGFDVQSVDTATIISYTSLGDSFATQSSTYFVLGDLYDPDFGKSNATIITQYARPDESLASWDNQNITTIDSIVLQIKYLNGTSYYGNKSTSQTIKVYELLEDLSASANYYSNRKYSYNQWSPIGTWNGNFNNLTDSVKYTYAGAQVTLAPHLRIKLDDPAYIQKFKNAPASTFASRANFNAYFKGLVISPETSPLIPDQGTIVNVDLRNDNLNTNVITSVVVYYDSTQKIEFPIYDEKNIKTNTFKQEHSVIIPIEPSLNGTQHDITYVQSMAGLKTRILIPHLFDFVKNQNIAINGAEVIIPIMDGSNTGTYTVPTRLFLFDTDSLGRISENEIKDFNIVDGYSSYYDGKFKSTSNQYSFNIMRHIQHLLREYKEHQLNYNYGLCLFVPENYALPVGRAKLDTRPGKIKLKLSYTVIK